MSLNTRLVLPVPDILIPLHMNISRRGDTKRFSQGHKCANLSQIFGGNVSEFLVFALRVSPERPDSPSRERPPFAIATRHFITSINTTPTRPSLPSSHLLAAARHATARGTGAARASLPSPPSRLSFCPAAGAPIAAARSIARNLTAAPFREGASADGGTRPRPCCATGEQASAGAAA